MLIGCKGFRDGDRAAIWAPNAPNGLSCAGHTVMGGTLVTVNTRYKASEARDIISDSGSSVVFVVDEFLGVDYAESLAALTIDGLSTSSPSRHPALQTTMASASGSQTERLQTMSYAVSAPRKGRPSTRDASDILFTQAQLAEPKVLSPPTARI